MPASSEIASVAPIAAADAIVPVSPHGHGQYQRQHRQPQHEKPKEENETDTVELSEQTRLNHHLNTETTAETAEQQAGAVQSTEAHLDIAV